MSTGFKNFFLLPGEMNEETIKKKVLHLVEDLRIGGLERVVASIVLGLDRTKYEVHVWCLTNGGEIAEELIEKGVSVKILGMHSYHNPLHILSLSRLIKKENIHILHTHGYFGSTFGRIAVILVRTPIIIAHVHTTYYGFKRRNLIVERLLSFFTDKIVCVSNAVKDFVEGIEGISEKRTCLIFNGVENHSLSERDKDYHIDRSFYGFKSTDFLVITVASLTPHKGHQVLIDAAHLLSKKHGNMRWLIVGDGPLRGRLETYTRELKLSSKIVFAGQQKHITSLLRMADLFVLPSTEREGLGIALIEAMAEGLPVIGTSLGGIPEVIEDKQNGLLVEPGSAYELATAIESLTIDEKMRREMGEAGRELYKRKFTITKMNQGIESLYEKLEMIQSR